MIMINLEIYKMRNKSEQNEKRIQKCTTQKMTQVLNKIKIIYSSFDNSQKDN